MNPALTTAQKQALKAFIVADPTLNAFANNSDGNSAVADALNAVRSPDYWVWRTFVGKHEYTDTVSVDGTSFSWTAYIARSQGERDGWREMFNSRESVNPSLLNVRQAFADIFSGSTNNAPAQRTHLTAMSRRKATAVEYALRTNAAAGTSVAPDTLGSEGPITYQEVQDARNS